MKKILSVLTILFCSLTIQVRPAHSLGLEGFNSISNINWERLVQPLAQRQTCSDYASDQNYFKGSASLVYFYMGDSYLTTLFQETTQLSKAFDGYDYKVLMYDTDATATSKISSARAVNQADEILDPTIDNFFDKLAELFADGYYVDVYIISHGGTYNNGDPYFVAIDGDIKGSTIEERLGAYGCGEAPVRMVYSVGCYHKEMNASWRAVGAKVVAGARHINFYPTQFGRFAKKWTDGENFKDAILASDTAAGRTIVQAYIYALGLKYSGKGECGLIPNVLGKTDCAEWYFTGGGDYNLDEEYISSKSGKANMNYSSEKIRSGDSSLTIDSVVDWYLPD